jgi:Rieske 2Fe-2S family protein
VQRGLSSIHARPGPLAGQEDNVYMFVTMVARGYLGGPVLAEPVPEPTTTTS